MHFEWRIYMIICANMKNESVLVIFGGDFPPSGILSKRQHDVIIADEKLRQHIEDTGFKFIPIGPLIEAGSIHDASAFLEELSYLKLADGSRLAKSFEYKGYELWWTHYDSLFIYFCLPYTQYKKLLEYLKSFRAVSFYKPPFISLFSCYLKAHGCQVSLLRGLGVNTSLSLTFGIFLQIALTILCLPVLMLRNRRLMIFIGDKFEKSQDYDFRTKFIYEELRRKNIPFVEFIRSLGSWKIVLEHFFIRKRPVVYSEAVVFIGRIASVISGGRRRALQEFDSRTFALGKDPETKFKLLVATQYLLGVYDDIWAIRIMKWILRAVGIKVSFIAATSERNFHTVLGCKLNGMPTVGIMHGVQIRDYNVYDFLPGFDGVKRLTVDKFGLWSEWWKEYYIKNSKAYGREQLYVSGPMRPLLKNSNTEPVPAETPGGITRVLFVSEEMAIPSEILPYLNELLRQKDMELTIKFRPTRDGFEEWLLQNEPAILKSQNLKIAKGNMQEAIRNTDVAVGCQSTGVIESLLQLKTPIYFRTRKWGDYYSLKEYDKNHSFFAESPKELIEKIKNARSVPIEALEDLQERYFGDPYENGSKWVVEQLGKCITD